MSQPIPSRREAIQSFLLGGVIPVVAFTVIEEYYGTVWGIVAGMVFGVGEIIFEKIKQGKVNPMTWAGNALIIGLGGVSLFFQEGIWFKLQPAIMEFIMAVLLLGSVAIGKPLLKVMVEKKNPDFPRPLYPILTGFTIRFGLFMLAHAGLATWAALYWSTTAWALLKGVGFTASMILYVVAEGYALRLRLRRNSFTPKDPNSSTHRN